MDSKNWFQEEPPPGHIERVLVKTDEVLKERLRRRFSSRFFNRWLLYLSPGLAAGVIAWIFQSKKNPGEIRSFALLDFMTELEEGELDPELYENLATLGDLETLEDFEDIEFLNESLNQETI